MRPHVYVIRISKIRVIYYMSTWSPNDLYFQGQPQKTSPFPTTTRAILPPVARLNPNPSRIWNTTGSVAISILLTDGWNSGGFNRISYFAYFNLYTCLYCSWKQSCSDRSILRPYINGPHFAMCSMSFGSTLDHGKFWNNSRKPYTNVNNRIYKHRPLWWHHYISLIPCSQNNLLVHQKYPQLCEKACGWKQIPKWWYTIHNDKQVKIRIEKSLSEPRKTPLLQSSSYL